MTTRGIKVELCRDRGAVGGMYMGTLHSNAVYSVLCPGHQDTHALCMSLLGERKFPHSPLAHTMTIKLLARAAQGHLANE
jgi:hypothetical protein